MGPGQKSTKQMLTPSVLLQFHRHLLSLSVQKISGEFISCALKAFFSP